MREHRKLLIAAIAVVAGYLAGAGLRQRALAPADRAPRAPAAAPSTSGERPRSAAGEEATPSWRSEPAAPAGEARGGGAAEAGPPLTFPDLGAGPPAIRAGVGSLLTSRQVRPGERLPASPFTSWLRPAQSLTTSAGVEVVLWAAGSHEPPPSAKGGTPVSRIPAAKVANPTRSWFLSTSAAPGRTAVLSLYDSSPFFARPDLACADTTTVSAVREVRAQPATLWIELDEIWTCERPRGAASRSAGPPLPVEGLFGMDRRVGFVVVVERDGTLRRLAAGVPVLQRRDDGATGQLEASFTEDGLFTLGAGSVAPSEEQEAWAGAFELDPLLRQALAAPTWIDEPMPGGPVPASCAPLRAAPRLEIEARAPVTRRPWSANPEVTVLAVPADVGRVQLRAVAIEVGGSRADVTDDPCLRLQLTGAGLRPMPTRSLFEVVGGPERIESATILALFRGQRVIVRFEEALPVPPALPPAAAAQLVGALPGLRLPDAEVAPDWDLLATGPGLVVGDLDWDGRDDVAAVLLDRERWELVVLTQTARGGYRLAFHAGAPRARPGPGEPIEQLSLRRTAAGDLSLRRAQGDRGEEWIVHHVGQGFSRTTLPLLRPDAVLTADQLGIAPHGARLDVRAAGREALLDSLQAGDAETFAAMAGMAPAQKAAAAGWIAGALVEARGDRSRLLVALALLGRPASEVAAPAVGALLFGGQPWRSDLEPRAAELALARMGEPALQLLALHPEAPKAQRAAAEIIREEPDLRDVYREALRRRPESLAVALAWAPITSPDELVEALRLLPSGRRHVLHRLRGLARSPRTPETSALLTAALPVLLEDLSSAGDPAEAAEVAQLVGELGSIAEPAVPALQASLWSHDCRVRAAARRALAALSARDPSLAAPRDLPVECPNALPPRGPGPTPPLQPAPNLPTDALVVRLLDRIDGRGFGFVSPIDLDWHGLAQTSLPGLDAEIGQGPLIEQARRKAARDEYDDHCVPFQAPLPAPLRRAHYYGVTAAGVAPLEPRKVLGDVCVGTYGGARYRGRVEARSGENGFVIVSGAALTVSEASRDALDPLWPTVAAACAIDPATHPRGIAFRLGRAGKTTQYAYAILPAGDLCTERRRLLRIEGDTAEVVEASDSGCAL